MLEPAPKIKIFLLFISFLIKKFFSSSIELYLLTSTSISLSISEIRLSKRSIEDFLRNARNIFTIRTLKGCVITTEEIVDALYKIKPPFNVNKMAQVFAIESLKDKKFIAKSIKHNLYWSKKLQNFFESKRKRIDAKTFKFIC